MELGEVSFLVNFFVLPLSGLDMVLGIEWLSQLGSTLYDWRAHSLKFVWAGQRKIISGLSHKDITQAHSHEIEKETKSGQACFALSITSSREKDPPMNEDMSRLLENFNDIFQPPSSLPPIRDIEHHITLKEGTDPINFRPYRYAHFQKEEIEQQVIEMLKSGLIQPSSSPFSSPVLLVKKKMVLGGFVPITVL